jgi:hypothetical protein
MIIGDGGFLIYHFIVKRQPGDLDMRQVIKLLCCTFVITSFSLAAGNRAEAQYAVAVQPVAPAVVGYTAQRRGLFGRRIVYRPIVAVAPVAVAVARPVVTSYYAPAAPVVRSYYAPAAPVVRSYYAPAAPVVRSYYAPAAPVATYYAPVVVPVRTYRIPVPTFVPVIGY